MIDHLLAFAKPRCGVVVGRLDEEVRLVLRAFQTVVNRLDRLIVKARFPALLPHAGAQRFVHQGPHASALFFFAVAFEFFRRLLALHLDRFGPRFCLQDGPVLLDAEEPLPERRVRQLLERGGVLALLHQGIELGEQMVRLRFSGRRPVDPFRGLALGHLVGADVQLHRPVRDLAVLRDLTRGRGITAERALHPGDVLRRAQLLSARYVKPG